MNSATPLQALEALLPLHEQPKNWLVESILTVIFGSLPFGIAGVVNAANVNSG